MKKYLEQEKKIFYFDSRERHAPYEFSQVFRNLLDLHSCKKKTLIFLCIGSDRATGDCLGPLLGYKLSMHKPQNYYVYGTLDHPVHAKNLDETINKIYEEHPDSFIVAVDASLGKTSHIGYITLGEGPLKPGAGVDKDLPYIGDLYITGIVNMSGFLDQMLLQTTRLQVVMSLVDRIFLGICYSVCRLE